MGFARGDHSPTSPWRRRRPDGVYFGHGGSVVAYFEWPLTPLQWEDAPVRIDKQSAIETAINDLGQTAVDLGSGMSSLALTRSIHLFAATFDRHVALPTDVPAAFTDFLSHVVPEVEESKTVLLGVKLWPKLMRNLVRATGGNLLSQAKALLGRNADSEDSFDNYSEDYADVYGILRRNGARVPSPESLAQLESWFNAGAGPEPQILTSPTHLQVTGGSAWEFSVVTEFTEPVLPTPSSQWLLDAMTHTDPAVAVSVRAELTPASVIRAQLRSSQRKLRSAEEEERKTGDIGRDDISETAEFARDLENTVRSSQTAWLTETSILLARRHQRIQEGIDTYRDELRTRHGIVTKPLEHRQLDALSEMQPCGASGYHPFEQVINPATLAYSGLAAFSNLGDPSGAWVGRVDPDYTSAYLDIFGASRHSKGPAMGVFGDPGSGKAQPLTSRVLTPSGWTTMGELRIGDPVAGRDGQTYMVTGVYPQGVKPIYRIEMVDGGVCEATDEHLWVARPGPQAPWQVLDTVELAARVSNQDGWQLPTATPIDPSPRTLRDTHTLPTASWVADIVAGRANPALVAQSLLTRREVLLTALLELGAVAVPGCPTDETGRPRTWTLRCAPGVRHALQAVSWSVAADTRHGGGELEIRLPHAAAAPAGRAIASVTATDTAPAQCISVSAPDRLYVTDDHIVTHNTFLSQLILIQAALSGHTVFMVNPKGFDSLAPLVRYVDSLGVPAQRISLQALEQEGGAFDPWRFAPPQMAAEIFNRHVLTVIGANYAGGGLTGKQEILLGEGLQRGAEAGARCAAEALAYVADPEVRDLVEAQARASSLFRLGYGTTPQGPLGATTGGLTLIEFDREVPFPAANKPPSTYEREERIALAGMRLITRASMETLMAAGGGVLMVDEAHHYLNSDEGKASLQRLGREGRSLKLLPIFATQRVSDLLNADMESYLSRVAVLSLKDPEQASAALRLCGLEDTEERRKLLKSAAPVEPSGDMPGRPAIALMRDIHDRHAAVMVGPVPESVRAALSTNFVDRERQQAADAAASAPEAFPSTVARP